MLDPIYDNEEVCPNCGEWGPLLEKTGWCTNCSGYTTCGCGVLVKNPHTQCESCRKEVWLAEHADRLEGYLYMGWSLYAAMRQVAEDIRPTCVNCGTPLHRAKQFAKFCKEPECRNMAKRYRTLRQTGLSPDIALQIVTGSVRQQLKT